MNNGHKPHSHISYVPLPQTKEAWSELREFMKETRGFVPPAQFGVASVARTQYGEIVGGLVLQPVPYLGPFKIKEEYRATIDYVALKKVIDSMFHPKGENLIIQGYVAMTDNEALARMAETAGMSRLPCITLFQPLGTDNVMI